MYIKKMTARFGALEGESLELSPGLNVIYAPNESGKSTWCAFLRAMLYGVDTKERARQGQQPDKKKYQPWSGTPMSGSMDIETADGPVTLRRWTERVGQPMQAFSATVTGTDTPVTGLTADGVGEHLTGVPREVFERTAFIRQAGLGVSSDPELDKRLAAIVSAGDEGQSYSETDKRLRTWLRRRKRAVPELEEAMAGTRRELEAIERSALDMDEMDRQIAQAQREQRQAEASLAEARRAQRDAAREAYNRTRAEWTAREGVFRQAQEEKDAAVAALQETVFGAMGPERAAKQVRDDLDQADELERQANALPNTLLGLIPVALGAAALIVSIFWSKMAWAIVGLVYLAMTVLLSRWRRGVLRTKDELLARRADIFAGYGVEEPGQIEELLDEYDELWQAAQAAARRLAAAETELNRARGVKEAAEERYMADINVIGGNTEAARTSHAVEASRARVEELRRRRDMAAGRAQTLGDPLVIRSELAAQEDRRAELLAQEEALELAVQTLEQADRELRERFSPQLARDAAALFSQLTGGRYDEITLARDLTAKARPAGDAVGREMDYLSRGAQDQLYLALRLAMCSLVLPQEQGCPIVLDDALVAFDRERMEKALALLCQQARTRQVLLFTCHERELDRFAGDETVTTIRLG